MEKLFPMERIIEILEQNPFPLARMKDLFQKYVSTRREKNWYKCLVSE